MGVVEVRKYLQEEEQKRKAGPANPADFEPQRVKVVEIDLSIEQMLRFLLKLAVALLLMSPIFILLGALFSSCS